jgi:PAS domain-containing protein
MAAAASLRGGGKILEALIDLFWSKYSDLQAAIEAEDEKAMTVLDQEIDPLLLAIFEGASDDPVSIQAQFRFALDLLNAEADDRGCVRRNAHLLQTLVERYLAPPANSPPASSGAEPGQAESSVIDEATANGILDDTLLSRISDRILLVAPSFRVLYSNETNARRMELPREELIGRHLAELIGLHRFRNEFEPNLIQCFEGVSASVTYADQVDGQTVVMHCRMSPFLRSSHLVGALIVIRETADRRKRPGG